MLSSWWQCSRCLGRCLRTAAKSHVTRRWQSTITLTSEAEVSSGLLERARKIAAEHMALSKANAENYDIATAKRMGELGPVTAALKEYEDAKDSLTELTSLLTDPSTDHELRDLAHTDLETAQSSLPKLSDALKTSLISPHPFATFPALLEIHPGAGGSEASIFAHDLLQMYISLCTRLGLPATLTSYTADDSAPGGSPALTEATLELSTPGTYDLLRTEAGVHRVQRIPATEKKGRTHTSAVSVLVMPALSEQGGGAADGELPYDDPNSDFYVNPADVKADTLRASGAGGQHVNKTESAVRLTHIPTNTVVKCQESRSQHKNREKAWNVLRSKIAQRKREEREEQISIMRRSVMGGVGRTGREDKVRTYNYSQSRVTDHRSGEESNNLDDVIGGGMQLELVMDSVREWMRENEVLGMLADDEARRLQEEKENRNGHAKR